MTSGGTIRKDAGVMLILSLLLITVTQGAGLSPPGKPRLTSCRSPEKETFTCWWEPGSDGGLPTTHALFYQKENVDTVYECSDYQTAGHNSCFFNKNHTSIWVNYNITVVATNALGSSFSEPVDVDVVYIVQPHTPENVTAVLREDADGPYLRVSWEPPRKADTRSGWITLVYELRVKPEGEDKWETHRAGQQMMFNIFSLRSGGVYVVEVRCKPDHGFWSEWSAAAHVKVPDHFTQEMSLGILIATFSAFIFIILTWILSLKRHSVKRCLLPPVPGPKIKGFDIHLLKSGKSEEALGGLAVQGFPPVSPDHGDLLVEYLEVDVGPEQEGKDGVRGSGGGGGGGPEPKASSSDSDSGRGSWDGRSLLTEKCGEGRAGRGGHGGGRGPGRPPGQPAWEALQGEDGQAAAGAGGEDSSGGRWQTWPSVFSPPPPRYRAGPSERGSLQTPGQLCFSHRLLPPPPSSSFAPAVPRHAETGGENPPPSLPSLQAHSELDIPGVESQRAAAGPQTPPSRSTEYAEVQRVNQQDMLLLQPLSSYSTVKGVVSDNVLLLQRLAEAADDRERKRPAESGCAANAVRPPEKTDVRAAALPTQGAVLPDSSGYVDTATMLPAF